MSWMLDRGKLIRLQSNNVPAFRVEQASTTWPKNTWFNTPGLPLRSFFSLSFQGWPALTLICSFLNLGVLFFFRLQNSSFLLRYFLFVFFKLSVWTIICYALILRFKSKRATLIPDSWWEDLPEAPKYWQRNRSDPSGSCLLLSASESETVTIPCHPSTEKEKVTNNVSAATEKTACLQEELHGCADPWLYQLGGSEAHGV